MKNRSNFIIAVLIVCFSNIAMAKASVRFTAEVSSSNTFVLKLKNPEETTVQVTLKDLDGINLHEEIYSNSGISQQYNLKNLPQGDYALIVRHDDLINILPITKKRDLLVIENEKLQTISPPRIDQNTGYLDIKMIRPSNLSVYLEIEDDYGHVLYGRRVKSEGQFRKRFNLKQLENGSYHFSVAIEGAALKHTYTELISLSTDY